MLRPIITLTTDFGLKDPYVAEMKAVILAISPKATIVDITHQVDKFDTLMGAYILASAYPYFPEGTIHVAIVDPGVGTRRRPLIIQTEKSRFVGPDNGVLGLAAKSTAHEKMSIYHITNREFMLSSISDTFHGRDIFAPVAAHLANGRSPFDFGKEIHRMISPDFSKTIRRRNRLEGQIIHIDNFGNIITNFTAKELENSKIESKLHVKIGQVNLLMKLCKAYGDVRKEQPLAIIGSNNLLEISVNRGSAAQRFNVHVGNKVSIRAQQK